MKTLSNFWKRTQQAFSWDMATSNKATLIDFNKTPVLPKDWELVIDSQYGGFSTGAFSQSENNTALFSGELSLELGPKMARSGFSVIMSRQGVIESDWGWYDTLALKVRGDGRRYLVNIKTDSVVPDTLFQHAIVPTANEWSYLELPLRSFVLTRGGARHGLNMTLNRREVLRIGFTVDSNAGPYALEISSLDLLRKYSGDFEE